MVSFKKTVLVAFTVTLVGCGGGKIVNHWAVDYTHTPHGAYMLNVNSDTSTRDSLKLLFIAQYFAAQEVALQVDSFQAFWGDSRVPVKLLEVHAQSKYEAGMNASGAGPFASLIVGAIRDQRKELLDSMRYSLLLTVTSLRTDSIIETIPIRGSLNISKL